MSAIAARLGGCGRSTHPPTVRPAAMGTVELSRTNLCILIGIAIRAGETEPAVRVALGHFIFVYIHPYITARDSSPRGLSSDSREELIRLAWHGQRVRHRGWVRVEAPT